MTLISLWQLQKALMHFHQVRVSMVQAWLSKDRGNPDAVPKGQGISARAETSS